MLVAATVTLTGLPASAAPPAPRTEPLRVTPAGKAGNGASSAVVISRDGRYADFSSTATDLLPGKPGGVFVRDPRTGRLERIGGGTGPSISGDGRYVAASLELTDRGARTTSGTPSGDS